MNKRIGLTVLLLMVFGIAFSQFVVKGKVMDASTSQALQGASVFDKQNKINIISDENGIFSLSKRQIVLKYLPWVIIL